MFFFNFCIYYNNSNFHQCLIRYILVLKTNIYLSQKVQLSEHPGTMPIIWPLLFFLKAHSACMCACVHIFCFQKCHSCPHLPFAKVIKEQIWLVIHVFYNYIRHWRLFIIFPKKRQVFEANTSRQMRLLLKSLN